MVHTVPQAEHLASLAHGSLRTPLRDPPDDLEGMFRSFTAASFVVEDKDQSFSGNSEFGTVPVIMRFEFRQRLLQNSGPEIMAIFTRFLDPKFKQRRKWKNATNDLQVFIENRVYHHEIFKPFSELRVLKQGLQATLCLARRVADRTDNARDQFEDTPSWSRFSPEMVDVLRDKMLRVFGMNLVEI
jgi:hypothetical protein